MTARASISRPRLAPTASKLLREALEPARGRAMTEDEVEEAGENLKKFYEILMDWDRQDRMKAAALEGDPDV